MRKGDRFDERIDVFLEAPRVVGRRRFQWHVIRIGAVKRASRPGLAELAERRLLRAAELAGGRSLVAGDDANHLSLDDLESLVARAGGRGGDLLDNAFMASPTELAHE